MTSRRKPRRGTNKAAKSKSKKTRAKKAAVKKGTVRAAKPQAEAATVADSVRPTAAAIAPAQPKTPEEMNAFIKTIGAPKLHDEDIAATVKHLNSVVAFRRAVGQTGAAARRALSGKCYMKSFGDPMVSIYEGFNHVGSMLEESAIAAGIPRCGA